MPTSTDKLIQFDDNYWGTLFDIVGDSGESYTLDCGTYEKAIRVRQIAYMWRTAAEKELSKRITKYNNATKDKTDNLIAALAPGMHESDMRGELSYIKERQGVLNNANKVMIKNKPNRSSILVFCHTKFEMPDKFDNLAAFAKRVKDKLDPDGKSYQLTENPFDD